MSYTKTQWNNDTAPAINETNLNKIEQGIYDNDSAITTINTNIGDLSDLETTTQTDIVSAINENVSDIDNLEDMTNGTKPMGDVVVDSIKTKNLFNKYVGTDGYLTPSGSIVSNPDHIVSDYVNIEGMSSITISGSQGSGLENCFYDSSKTVIGHFALSSASTTQEVPSGTKYIRVTVKKTALDTYQLEGGSTATNYTSYFDSNNIGQMTDYVKLVKVNKGSSLTLNGDASTEISLSGGIPTIQGYKLIGCIGGAGVGNTGLLVSSSVGSSINLWVHNTKGTQQTWSDVEVDLLYIRDL